MIFFISITLNGMEIFNFSAMSWAENVLIIDSFSFCSEDCGVGKILWIDAIFDFNYLFEIFVNLIFNFEIMNFNFSHGDYRIVLIFFVAV